ncbi:MAG: ABC transporter ATP-binding protein [Eubacterium sp.]|nr:ABC transporter ATP-binding protein [Eubacterium sp.]
MTDKKVRGWLFGYIKAYRPYVILSLICALINVAATLVIPVFIGMGIDGILSKGNVIWDEIYPVMLMIGGATLIAAVSAYIMGISNNRITIGVVKDIRRDAFDRLHGLTISYIDTHKHGDMISRVISDADTLSDGLLMGFSTVFTGGLSILGTLGFMFGVSAPIAAAVVVVTPISLFVAGFIAKRSYKMFLAQSEDRGEQTSLMDEALFDLRTIKAFSQEERIMRDYDDISEKLKNDSLGATFFSSITNPATRFVNSLVYGAVGVIGALFAVKGSITVGVLTCFLSYANQYTKPFNEISGVVAELQNAIACAKRIMELSYADTEDVHGGDTVLTDTNGKVSVEKIYFSYDDDGKADKSKALIQDLSLTVEPGSRVAIVGPTGAGKSTIINLLMRFYDVDSGTICVDGKDINTLTHDSLRGVYGMVLQETWLSEGTVRECIAYGREDATFDEIVAACKACHAHEFIMRLESGYDTVIRDDSGLSEGMRQLLCIARAMLSLPQMLILDEATSSIDARTELKIQSAFSAMMVGRTSFIVAHRLKTIESADVILVMKDGRVIEQGSHEQLLAAGGFYKELYEASG